MIINVKVFPKSKQQKIEKVDDVFKVHLLSAPEKGKANKELFQILSDHFSASKNQMLILQGATSQSKIIRIDNADKHITENNQKTYIPNYIDCNKKRLDRIHSWDEYVNRER